MSSSVVTPPTDPPDPLPDEPGPRRRWRRVRRPSDIFLLVALSIAVGGPLILLLANSLNIARPGDAPQYGFSNWLTAFSTRGLTSAIWNTLSLGVTRTILATAIACFLAWLIARTDMPGRSVLEFSLWVAFVIPSLPLTLGWILLLDPSYGLVNEFIRGLGIGSGEGPFNIYSYWGIVWVHLTASSVPFMVALIVPAFRLVDRTLEESARVCGASAGWTAFRVTLPSLTPAILTAAILSFIWSLKAFEVELILGHPVGINVYSTQIYEWIRETPPLFGIATALGSVFIIFMMAIALMYRRILRDRDYQTVGARAFSSDPIPLGPIKRWVAFLGVLSFMLITIVLPVGFVVVGSFMRRYGFFSISAPFTTRHWSGLLGDSLFAGALWNTALLAGGRSSLV